MLTNDEIKLIEIFDDNISQTINHLFLIYPKSREISQKVISVLLHVLDRKFCDNILWFEEEKEQYVKEIYGKILHEFSEEKADYYNKLMIKIYDTDLDDKIKLAFRKNEFFYLGDIAICSPALLCKLADWDVSWHIPVRNVLLEHGLDLCSIIKEWPYIRREMSND